MFAYKYVFFFYSRINFICIFNIFLIIRNCYFSLLVLNLKMKKKIRKSTSGFFVKNIKMCLMISFLYKKLSIVLLVSHRWLIFEFILNEENMWKKRNFQLNFSLIWLYCLKAFYFIYIFGLYFVTHKNRKNKKIHIILHWT